MLTQSRLMELVSYDGSTGSFSRRGKGTRGGSPVESKQSMGYLRIWIDGRHYLSHRLAWLYVYGEWPPCEIDHRNGDRADNRKSNLRTATRAGNTQNSRIRKTNKLGLKGVEKHGNAYRAYIRLGGKKVSLGVYSDAEIAHAVYVAKAKECFGEFARAA